MKITPQHNQKKRKAKAAWFALKHLSLTKASIRHAIEHIYNAGTLKSSRLTKKTLSEIAPLDKEIKLLNFDIRGGNVSHYELLVIATLIAKAQPRRLLEIGTFDGNTTLQMALNSPESALIHTLDLPSDPTNPNLSLLNSDLKFIRDPKKLHRKYLGTPMESKIIQHIGDSTTYDFSQFGPIDFAFIDGGHSYECVRNDTEKALKILSPNGILLWHDFTPCFFSIYHYLNDLALSYPLIHIANTNLAFYALGGF